MATIRNRSFWPFDNYPMYSFPLEQIRYPVLRGQKLYMLTLVDITNNSQRDLLYGQVTRTPDIHPMSRLEIGLLLVKAGFMSEVYSQVGERNKKHFGSDIKDNLDHESQLKKELILKDILRFIQTNNSQVNAIEVHLLEWEDIWQKDVNSLEPSKRTVLGVAKSD